MEIEIDIDKIKRDLLDYHGTGAFSGMPAMMIFLNTKQDKKRKNIKGM
jgi:hypothetical protein